MEFLFLTFWRNLQTVFCSGCTILQSHQPCTKGPISPYAHQHFVFSVFLIIVILMVVRWYLIVVLIYIPLMTQWTWVWVNSRSWWWTGRPGVLRFMGSQKVGHDWATELNWTSLECICFGISVFSAIAYHILSFIILPCESVLTKLWFIILETATYWKFVWMQTGKSLLS